MRFEVTTPVAGFTGTACGVVFRDGVGTVDDSTDAGRAAVAYFGRRGYTLAPVEAAPAAPAPAPAGPPAKNAAKAEWVAYAVAQGADQAAAEALTVAQLIDQYGKGAA
ncbi:hypothetical protein ACWENS_05600 [Streptomyces sp. NPDC004532]